MQAWRWGPGHQGQLEMVLSVIWGLLEPPSASSPLVPNPNLHKFLITCPRPCFLVISESLPPFLYIREVEKKKDANGQY